MARRGEDIERSVEEAIEISTTNEQAAREILADVETHSKLIVFMTDLEVSAAVDIEELVPVVLADSKKLRKLLLTKLT